MSEPLPDALFGVDGTELPEVLPDPSGRLGWRSTFVLPPLELPALPDASLTPEAIAAALGEDPPGPEVQDPDTADQPAAAQPAPAQPAAAQAAPAQPGVAKTPAAAPPPQAGLPPPGGASSHHLAGPSATTTVTAPRPSARKIGRLRYRTPLAAASRDPVPHIDFGRRTSRRGPAWPLRTRSNGGASIALVIGLIIFGVLVYYIIAGIVESVARLIPW